MKMIKFRTYLKFLFLFVVISFSGCFQAQDGQPAKQAKLANRPKLAEKTYTSRTDIHFPEEIEGKIVTLKRLNEKYFYDYFSMFSAQVRKDLEFPPQITYNYIETYLTTELAKNKKNLLLTYCIFDNEDKKMVGALGIREKNIAIVGQLGMWINEQYWGGGRIQEALYLISKAYFDTRTDRDEFVVHVRPYNKRSISAMEKFGFVKIDDYIEDGKVTRFIYQMTRDKIEKKKP